MLSEKMPCACFSTPSRLSHTADSSRLSQIRRAPCMLRVLESNFSSRLDTLIATDTSTHPNQVSPARRKRPQAASISFLRVRNWRRACKPHMSWFRLEGYAEKKQATIYRLVQRSPESLFPFSFFFVQVHCSLPQLNDTRPIAALCAMNMVLWIPGNAQKNVHYPGEINGTTQIPIDECRGLSHTQQE